MTPTESMHPLVALRLSQDSEALDKVKAKDDCKHCGGNGQNYDESLCICITSQVDRIIRDSLKHEETNSN